MFDTCSEVNRKIEEPLLTTFTKEYFKGYYQEQYPEVLYYRAVIRYTRIRRAKYRYIGCTRACAITKANELNMLFNREVMNAYSRHPNGMMSDGVKNFRRAADVTITRNDNNSHDVVVTLDEELIRWYNDTNVAPYYWRDFELNPDLVTGVFKYNGTEASADFDYDGII